MKQWRSPIEPDVYVLWTYTRGKLQGQQWERDVEKWESKERQIALCDGDDASVSNIQILA